MSGQIHRRFNPSFIINFDDNDNVASVWTQFGDMPTIKEMNGIIEYAKAYLNEYKTQDALDLIDYRNREADRIEQEEKDRKEREERKAQKFQKKVAIHAVLEGLNKRVSGEWFSLNEADIEYFHFYFKKEPLAF